MKISKTIRVAVGGLVVSAVLLAQSPAVTEKPKTDEKTQVKAAPKAAKKKSKKAKKAKAKPVEEKKAEAK